MKIPENMSDQVATDADVAKQRLQHLGLHYKDKTGGSIMHVCVDGPVAMVHVCAAAGAAVNAQNFAGDTALHVAVRKGRQDIARALLMVGADTAIKNKLGQTANEEATGSMEALLHDYRPGLVQAVSRGEFAAIIRLIKRWCNLHSIIKDGKTALQIAAERSSLNGNVHKCYNILLQSQRSLELIHAVLAENQDRVQEILAEQNNLNINLRYKDRRGWTPVACAVLQRNKAILQHLVGTGRANLNIRLLESAESPNTTTPLYFSTLTPSCPADIWEFVNQHMDPRQRTERDYKGNTPIFHAIESSRSADFIKELLIAHNGDDITQRNKEGLAPRELADELGRQDIVTVIDQYLFSHISGELLMRLPVAFYGKENMAAKNQNSKRLQDMAIEENLEQGIQATKNYGTIEEYGLKLFQAAATGDLKTVSRLNKAAYVDKNGYTALIRAIVYNQPRVAELLIVERPALKSIPDNSNRYPLHYAYSLAEDQGWPFINMLLQDDLMDLEHRVDKDGLEAAEYKERRDWPEVLQMLDDARTLDAYGKRGQSLGEVATRADHSVPES